MMRKSKIKLLLITMIPFMYGCGVGGAAFLGSLFGGSFLGAIPFIGLIPIGGEGGIPPGGPGGPGGIVPGIGAEPIAASLHNPEPATMLLLGGGIVAMGLISSKKKK